MANNIYAFLGDLSVLFHFSAILILLYQIHVSGSCQGISFKTQALYAVVFVTRYTDISNRYVSLYITGVKVFFTASSFYILYLMRLRFRTTLNSSLDTFRIEYLIFPCAFLALIFNHRHPLHGALWSFSIFLESVSILPQLSILINSSEIDNIDIKLYIAMLGTYRALYIPNWVYRLANPERTCRYIFTRHFDWIAVSGAIVQTLIYLEYSQPFWSPISGRIGVALSRTSAQEEKVLIDDAQEKGFSVHEKPLTLLGSTRTPRGEFHNPPLANDSTSE